MSWTAKAVAGVGAVLGCMALWLPAAGAATLSDSFAGRETVKGVPQTVAGTNVGAGREAAEPVLKPLSPAGHSVWLEWEAESQGYHTVSTCGSAIPTVTGIYTGSVLATLNEYESGTSFVGPECSPIRNGVTFLVVITGKYQIVVDGNDFFVPPALPPVTEGPIALRIEATPPAPNDAFANAATIAGRTTEEPGGDRFYFADVFGYNWNATKEKDEPKHAGDSGGSSVWYSWTAPESGLARISLCCGTANLRGVYTGDAVDALTGVQSGKGSLEVPVTAGTTYRIAVDSEFSLFLGGTLDDSFNLMVAMKLAPGSRPSGGDAAAVATGPGSGPGSDVQAPNATIDKRKIRSKARSATFSFSASEPGSTFRCRLDGRKAAQCKSPKAYPGLATGPHTFRVYAVDAAGNADPTPATARFSIARTPRSHG